MNASRVKYLAKRGYIHIFFQTQMQFCNTALSTYVHTVVVLPKIPFKLMFTLISVFFLQTGINAFDEAQKMTLK